MRGFAGERVGQQNLDRVLIFARAVIERGKKACNPRPASEGLSMRWRGSSPAHLEAASVTRRHAEQPPGSPPGPRFAQQPIRD